MMEDGIRNARIENTFLGIEDHGIFILTLYMDYGATKQGYQRILGKEDNSAYKALRNILEVLRVQSWEDLRGITCRVRVENGLIRAIGHLLVDEWTVEPEG